MSITREPQLKQYIPQPAANNPESQRGYGTGIAMMSGALGAAIALVGAAQVSLPLVVAAAIILGGWGFLIAANHSGK
jgi:hypothetical protein